MTAEPRPTDDARVPERRIVLHPQTAAARRQDLSRPSASHVRGYSVEEDAVFALIKTKRRRSMIIVAIVLIPLLSFMVALALWPALGLWTPLGPIPFPWLALGPIALFSIVALALVHDRRTIQLEQQWSRSRDQNGTP